MDNLKYNFGESDIEEEGDDLGEGSLNVIGISYEFEGISLCKDFIIVLNFICFFLDNLFNILYCLLIIVILCSVLFDDVKMELRVKILDVFNGENFEIVIDYEFL